MSSANALNLDFLLFCKVLKSICRQHMAQSVGVDFESVSTFWKKGENTGSRFMLFSHCFLLRLKQVEIGWFTITKVVFLQGGASNPNNDRYPDRKKNMYAFSTFIIISLQDYYEYLLTINDDDKKMVSLCRTEVYLQNSMGESNTFVSAYTLYRHLITTALLSPIEMYGETALPCYFMNILFSCMYH